MVAPRTNASHDQNRVTTLLGVSTTDGTTPVPVEVDPATGAMLMFATSSSSRTTKGRQVTTITSSTAETTIVTAAAASFIDIYGLIISNSSATACEVTIKDATAGTTVTTFEVNASDTKGFMLPTTAAVQQTAVNNNWTATCGTSVASIKITALYVLN